MRPLQRSADGNRLKRMNEATFEEFESRLSADGTEAAIEMLCKQFESDGDYFQLFEILKVRCRHRLGLSLLPTSTNEAGDQLDELESGLLEACREVGTLLFRAGKPDEGWVYLQPVGDQALAKGLLMDVPVTEENQDLIIDLGLGQNIAPAYAFEMMLKAYGTCNAITTIDVKANQGGFSPGDLEAIAEILLKYFYDDLLTSVRKDVAKRAETNDTNSTLGELLEQHPWLVVETGHHVDATHLNSIMRIARYVRSREYFQMAKDLCRYGQRLADDFKYAGDPPFESTYDDHVPFFSGLLNEETPAAIEHFEKKLADCEAFEKTNVAEVFVAWLVRMGRNDLAFEVSLEHIVGKEAMGIAPSIVEIANTPELKQRLIEHFQSTGDLLGYAICKLQLEQEEG